MADGVVPTKLPSISISAFAGIEDTEILFAEVAPINLSVPAFSTHPTERVARRTKLRLYSNIERSLHHGTYCHGQEGRVRS